MSDVMGRFFCQSCNDWRKCVAPGTNHLLHLALSVVTGGLWLIVWFCGALATPQWRCDDCGAKIDLKINARRNREEVKRAKAEKRAKKDDRPESEKIPPKPSVLHERAHAEWMAKYGDR